MDVAVEVAEVVIVDVAVDVAVVVGVDTEQSANDPSVGKKALSTSFKRSAACWHASWDAAETREAVTHSSSITLLGPDRKYR